MTLRRGRGAKSFPRLLHPRAALDVAARRARARIAARPWPLLVALLLPTLAAGAAAQDAPTGDATAQSDERLADAQAATQQAMRLRAEGRLQEALQFAEEAAAACQAALGAAHPLYALTLNNLGDLCRAMGDYARAESLLVEALQIAERADGDNRRSTARILNNLAVLDHELGRYESAEEYGLRAVETRRQALGESHPEYATSLANLAALYEAMGRYVEAESLYRRAMEIDRRAYEQDPEIYGQDYAVDLNNLASLYDGVGDAAAAEALYRQALEILRRTVGERHIDYAAALNNLAWLYVNAEQYDRAEPLYAQALEITEQVVGADHAEFALSLNNLAHLYYRRGDFDRAEPLFRRAIEVDRAALGATHPGLAVDLNNLAELYRAAGDVARAEPLYEQALAMIEQALGRNHLQYAGIQNNLAALIRPRDPEQAAPLYRQSLTTIQRHLEASSAALSERQQLELAGTARFYLDSYLTCLLQIGARDRDVAEALLPWKGATLMWQRAARQSATDPRAAQVLADLQAVVRQWAALARTAPRDNRLWKQRLDELSAKKERLEAELSRTSAAFRQAALPPSLEQVAAALPPDAVLIDYLEIAQPQPGHENQKDRRRWPRRLVAAVVSAHRPPRAVDLGAAQPIVDAIEQWRETHGDAADARAAARLLREKLWDPLAEELSGATTVFISPDGELGRMAFAALPGDEPGTYLIEDVRLALAPVPRLLALAHDAVDGGPPPAHDLLLLGGVDYDRREDRPGDARGPEPPANRTSRGEAADEPDSRWAELPGAADEVRTIEQLFRRRRGGRRDAIAMLVGAAATEGRFCDLAPRCQWLHLATHGYFLARTGPRLGAAAPWPTHHTASDARGAEPSVASPGLLSGLVFAGANLPAEFLTGSSRGPRPADDGVLTADELALLPLGGVELAVLSACDTGLGPTRGGEGLLGIQRSLQIAGVRNVVATLWKVDDRMTQRLMVATYRNLLERNDAPLDALRNAQLELIRELRAGRTPPPRADNNRGVEPPADDADDPADAPRDWAAFTFTGDAR